MTVAEAAKLLILISDLWGNFRLSETSAESWASVFPEASFEEMATVVAVAARTREPGYLPDVNSFSQQLIKLRHPVLSLSYEEAAKRRTVAYRKAQELVCGKRADYNPYAHPDSLPKDSDLRWDEKKIKEVYQQVITEQVRKRSLVLCAPTTKKALGGDHA